jgi:hypothetical protein
LLSLPLLLRLSLLPPAGLAITTTCSLPVVAKVACGGIVTVNLQLTLLGFEPPPRLVAAGSAIAPLLSVGQVTIAATDGPVRAGGLLLLLGAGLGLFPLLVLLVVLLLVVLDVSLLSGGPPGLPSITLKRSKALSPPPDCLAAELAVGTLTTAARSLAASAAAAAAGVLGPAPCCNSRSNRRKPRLVDACGCLSLLLVLLVPSTRLLLVELLLLLLLLRRFLAASVALTRTSRMVNGLSLGFAMLTVPDRRRVELLIDLVTCSSVAAAATGARHWWVHGAGAVAQPFSGVPWVQGGRAADKQANRPHCSLCQQQHVMYGM